MDIYERLREDHQRQKDLAAQIVDTVGDSDERRRLWDELKAEAESHANAEEQTFYAALFENPDTQEQARHSVSEHEDASELIAELDELDMSSSGWLQKFDTLKHDLEHHIDEEQNDVFPMAREVLNDDAATELADDFDARKRDELAQLTA